MEWTKKTVIHDLLATYFKILDIAAKKVDETDNDEFVWQ